MNGVVRCLFASLLSVCAIAGAAEDKFKQLDEWLPTPNGVRTASGAPGHAYWQQRADYVIRAQLDEVKRSLTGSATITYHNHSPDTLRYLWLQLDQNIYKPDADARSTAILASREAWASTRADDGVKFNTMRTLIKGPEFPGGFQIDKVLGPDGQALKFVVNRTMVRLDLPQPLPPGGKYVFAVDWRYNISDHTVLGGRSGYEHFDEDKNDIFQIAQWFPRMAAYYDAYGWQHKQFLGAGEFALEFGDYDVQLTVPADHVVAATGELQNPEQVLTASQRSRLLEARSSKKPVLIVTPQEAMLAEKNRSVHSKTWHFKAQNVRDFAWASSRKFIWDAQGYQHGDVNMMAMSFYPKEGNPLWGQYSTAAIVHTVEQYNQYSFDYPYPVAISVNGPVGGMEYPMISFNGPRPTKDKKTGDVTYSKKTKYALIGVIIHEVGHNYFPMVVNSDERQWAWLDEGINTFLQYIAQQAWEKDWPRGRGDPASIVDYMRSKNQVPIMTAADSVLQLGNNAYAKPAAALNILRETILGRELFDFALREYAQRWKFKRPTPADFFRTIEDASGTDLDWFWRGWFYTTDAVDISLDGITQYTVSTKDPEVEKAWKRAQRDAAPIPIADQRNAGTLPRRVDSQPELKDFYSQHDDFTVTNKDRNRYKEQLKDLDDWEKELLQQGKYLYQVDFSNRGGLVMPLILQIELKSGKKYIERIPAEVWRFSPEKITKLLITDEPMVALTQDPFHETADIDVENNAWPRKIVQSRVELFKQEDRNERDNLMRDMKTPLAK